MTVGTQAVQILRGINANLAVLLKERLIVVNLDKIASECSVNRFKIESARFANRAAVLFLCQSDAASLFCGLRSYFVE